MMYILGLVGHPDTNQEVKDIIIRHFDNIDFIEISVINDEDINVIKLNLKKYEKKCMGFLFTAKDIYHLFNSKMTVKTKSAYLEDNNSEILKILFIASQREGTDYMNISIDSISYEEIKGIYHELKISETDGYQILTIPLKLSNTNLVDKITDEHEDNYNKFGSTCITFFTDTKNRLNKKNIPVLKVGINKHEVIKRVNGLISSRYSKTVVEMNRVAIVIKLGELKEHLIIENSEHSVLIEFNRISESVFWFSEKLDGAYIPNDQRKYIIFCNRKKYENITDYSMNIEILNEVANKNYFSCYMGVGYGANDREAIKNATIAQIKSSKDNRSSAYIMYDSNKIAGPLLPSSEFNNRKDTIYDVKLNEIASKTQVGINTIYKLYSLFIKSGERDHTSKDISDYLGITIRSTNRLFAKLTKSGYIKMVGEKSNGEKGRPIRVYRFLF